MSQGPKRDWKPEELELDWKGRAPPEQRQVQLQAQSEQGLGEPGKGMPGEPRSMSLEMRLALGGLLEGPGLVVRQNREMLEAITGWETRNSYDVVSTADARTCLTVTETGEGFAQSLLRNLWPFRRVTFDCMTLGGTLALKVERPWTFFFARAEVSSWDGRPMGTIGQTFSLLRRKLIISNPAGAELATIEGPWWKPWTFLVYRRGEQVAAIRKQWNGLLQEAMTDADTFGVEFSAQLTDPRLRQLVLAATLLVDLVWFENRSNSSGISSIANLGDLFD